MPLVHAALRDARIGELTNLARFRNTLEMNGYADNGVAAEAVDWAAELNVEAMQRHATAGMVHGWESLLEVCVQRAPAVAPDLLSGDRGLVALKELLMACALMLEQHPDAEMQVAEPLARSCVVLVHQLRIFHPLVSFHSAQPVLTLDVDWGSECLRLLLAALTRRTARSSHDYRASVVTAFNQLMRHLTLTRSAQDMLLEAGSSAVAPSSEAVSAAHDDAAKCAQACEIHREASLRLLRETYDEVVGVLAKDACSEVGTASSRCRVASLGALTLILQILYEDEDDTAVSGGGISGGDGPYLSAKVLQSLWSDHHLERFVGMATSGAGDDCAMALLLQVSLSELGANALRELGLVSHLIRHLSSDGGAPGQVETLTSACRVLSSMLGSLPANAKLNEDVLRFIGTVRKGIGESLDADRAFASTAGLRAAAASARLLASFVGSVDPSRRDRILNASLEQGGELQSLLPLACSLLAQLADFPHGNNGEGGGLGAWSHPKPINPHEQAAARVKLPLPPLGLSATAVWSAFDDLKAELWWELLRASTLLLRRMTSYCSTSPVVSLDTLVGTVTTCLCVAEQQFQSRPQHSSSSCAWLPGSSLLVLENLMALATTFLQRSSDHDTRPALKAGLWHLLPRVAGLYGTQGPSALNSAIDNSDWFLKKVARLLQDELGVE